MVFNLGATNIKSTLPIFNCKFKVVNVGLNYKYDFTYKYTIFIHTVSVLNTTIMLHS